jgi:hypothetical protein
VKTLDNKRNLLMYVVEEVEKKLGEKLVKDETELELLDVASKLPTTQLSVDLNEIKKGNYMS